MITLDSHDYRECIKRGTDLYWRTLGRCRNMELHRGEVEYVMSNPRGGIERIFSVQFSAESVDRKIDAMVSAMKEGTIPDNILILPGTNPPDLADELAARGFDLDVSGECMALDLAGLPGTTNGDTHIKVVEVLDADLLREWTRIVNAALFECDLLSFEQFSDMFSIKNTRFFLGFYEGQPAATAMTISDYGIATLEMVSTLHEFRHRGLGTAVVVAALSHLHDCGARTVTLRAEPDAVNLYKRIGFKDYGKRVVATIAASRGSD